MFLILLGECNCSTKKIISLNVGYWKSQLLSMQPAGPAFSECP